MLFFQQAENLHQQLPVEHPADPMTRENQQGRPGDGIMEADNRQVRQFSQSNRHSTISTGQTEYHEALPSPVNDEVRCDRTFVDDGNAL